MSTNNQIVNSKFKRKHGKSNDPQYKEPEVKPKRREPEAIDQESLCGRFGWYSLDEKHIPYIIRRGCRYCAVKMFEKIAHKYMMCINKNIYVNCTSIQSYYTTKAERSLLEEINDFHCDNQFGSCNYIRIIPLEDAAEFYNFLEMCYNKLYKAAPCNSCGFVKIGGTSVVPYILIKSVKYLPLFYFEGVEESQLKNVILLTGYNLWYLRFCYKIQTIRDEFIKQTECKAVSMAEAQDLFGSDFKFEEYWPDELPNLSDLINPKQASSISDWFKPAI